MSDGGQSAVTVCFRTGKSRDISITVRADTPDELIEWVNVVEQGATRFSQVDEALNPAPPENIQDGVRALADGGITGEVISGDAGGKVCPHGAMVLKSGTGKNGKPWTAYMCRAPKGQTCSPIWL